LIVIFETECPKLLGAIRSAVERGDASALEMNAHGLKGACSTFSAGPSTDRARELEMMGRNKQMDGSREMLGRLEKEIHSLLAEFEAFPRKVAAH
jgi:HPt (histidine-containing phosphotransfer) domain-containing protein